MKNLRLYYWADGENFGDELSEYLLFKLTGERPIIVGNTDKDKLLAIGSIISRYTLYSKSYIWGSGVLSESERIKLKVFPLTYFCAQLFGMLCFKSKIYALRGPLTKQRIEEQSLSKFLNNKMFVNRDSCVFGDPAVLLPRVYQTKTQKQHYQIGIILHHTQKIPKQLASSLEHVGIHFINILRSSHQELESFIDEVNSCDRVFSASLHGIIIAQSYKIPSQWVQVKGSSICNDSTFKFHDYFLGVGLEPQIPLQLDFNLSADSLADILFNTNMPTHNFAIEEVQDRLLKAFPFPDKLKQQYRR